MNTNPPSYLPPHYTPQSGNGSYTILKDLSEIPQVILFNMCTNTYMYTHIYTYILTCLFVIVIIWLFPVGFILVDFAIEHEIILWRTNELSTPMMIKSFTPDQLD